MTTKITRLPSDQFRARGYKTTATPFFLLKVKKNYSDNTRIGVVVGISVHKTAVKRNFWKRQVLTELTRHANTGSDILMIVLPGANSITKKKFREEILDAFAAAQLK